MLVDMAPNEIPEYARERVVKLMNILNLISRDQYQCGKTKILKSGQLAALEERRTAMRIKSIVTIQKFIRGSFQQQKFNRTRNAALSSCKHTLAKTIAETIGRQFSATILQRYIRSWRDQQMFLGELGREKSEGGVRRLIFKIQTEKLWRCRQTKLRGIKRDRNTPK